MHPQALLDAGHDARPRYLVLRQRLVSALLARQTRQSPPHVQRPGLLLERMLLERMLQAVHAQPASDCAEDGGAEVETDADSDESSKEEGSEEEDSEEEGSE